MGYYVSVGNNSSSLSNSSSNTSKSGVVSNLNSGVDLNFRSGPNTDYSIIGELSEGTSVTILSENNGWYKIKAGKTTGYIRKDLLSKNCILLDISDQRLYYFTEGQLSWSTRVVTGNQGNHDTPIGNYTLNPNNLEQDRYLKGTLFLPSKSLDKQLARIKKD